MLRDCLHKNLTAFILAQRSQYDRADCPWKKQTKLQNQQQTNRNIISQ